MITPAAPAFCALPLPSLPASGHDVTPRAPCYHTSHTALALSHVLRAIIPCKHSAKARRNEVPLISLDNSERGYFVLCQSWNVKHVVSLFGTLTVPYWDCIVMRFNLIWHDVTTML